MTSRSTTISLASKAIPATMPAASHDRCPPTRDARINGQTSAACAVMSATVVCSSLPSISTCGQASAAATRATGRPPSSRAMSAASSTRTPARIAGVLAGPLRYRRTARPGPGEQRHQRRRVDVAEGKVLPCDPVVQLVSLVPVTPGCDEQAPRGDRRDHQHRGPRRPAHAGSAAARPHGRGPSRLPGYLTVRPRVRHGDNAPAAVASASICRRRLSGRMSVQFSSM